MAKEKTYAERFRNAKADGKAEQVSFKLHDKWEPGDTFAGKLESVSYVTFDEQAEPVIQYVFDADEGRVSCLFGRGTDKQIMNAVRIGDVIGATFKGQRDIAGGHKVNEFDIHIIEPGNGKTVKEALAEQGEKPKPLERDLPENGKENDTPNSD